MTFGATPIFNLHRACESRETALLRDRDRLESELFRAAKRYDELLAAYQELTTAAVHQYQPQFDMSHLFAEREVPVGQHEFLTPSWATREGEAEEPA